MYSSALSSELAASPSSHSAAALGLLIDSEEVTIEAAVSQGPTPQGKTYTVTDSTKGYILELDGTPTAELLPELAQLAKRHGDGSLFVGIAVDGSSKDAREAKACSSSAGGEPRPLGEDSHGSNYIVRPVVAADRGVMHPKGFLLLGGVPAELVLPGATLRFHFFEKDSCEAHFQRVLAASSLANASTNSTNSTNSTSTSGAKKSARGAETASGEDGSQSQSQSFNGHRNGHSSKGTHAALVFSCLARGGARVISGNNSAGARTPRRRERPPAARGGGPAASTETRPQRPPSPPRDRGSFWRRRNRPRGRAGLPSLIHHEPRPRPRPLPRP